MARDPVGLPDGVRLYTFGAEGPLAELGHDLLLGPSASGLFRRNTIRTWLRREGTLLPRHGGKLWLVLTLELWLRSFHAISR